MHPYQALLLLLGCGCLARTGAQEQVAGEEAQKATEVFPERGQSVGNGENDAAVAAIWHNNLLFVAIQTTGFLDSNTNANFGEAGTSDIVIKSLNTDLEEEESTQIGGDGNDTVTAIAGDESLQNNFVIVGSTKSEDDHLFPDTQEDAPGLMDWFIAEMSSGDLEVVGSYVNGTVENDQEATAVVIDPLEGGSYYVAGWTWGEYFEENAGSDNDDDSVGYDAWVVKISSLDIEDEIDWGIQFGTVAYDEPSAIVASGSNVYVVGTIRDDSNVLSAAEEAVTPSMFVRALDGSDDGELIWELDEEALGVLTDNSQAHGAVLNARGTELFVSGNTQGIIPGYDGETTGSDELFVMAIDTEDGTVNWVWQSEANATAFGTGGIVLADDGVSPIVGAIAFGNQFNLTFEYWENGSGDMIAAKIDPDDLEVSKYFVAPGAINTTREQPLAMVLDPDVEDGVFLIGIQDGDYFDEDVVPEPDPANSAQNLTNFLVLKVGLEEFPEKKEEDTGRDFPYYYIGVPVFAIGGLLFLVAYKWAAASQAAKAKAATMI